MTPLYAPGVCMGFAVALIADRLAFARQPDDLVIALALALALSAVLAVLSRRP